MELDHLFICTEPGAPEAEELIRFGLREGLPNSHPGQGTANRRFSFANAMIELLWVSDAAEAQSEAARRTMLLERWSHRECGASPFGICLRPADPEHIAAPFRSWEYRPKYLPDPLVMHIGEAGIEEPMWVYLDFMRRSDREERFVDHPNGVREITGLELTTTAPLTSSAAETVVKNGIVSLRRGAKPFLEVELDGGRRGKTADIRPRLPLIFKF